MLYYWYFYFSPATEKLSTKKNPDPPLPLPTLHFIGSNVFQFKRNQNVLWEHTLTTPFAVSNGKITQQSACIGVQNDSSVLADDEMLYQYLKTNSSIHNDAIFRDGTDDILQKGNVFYFKCRNDLIHSVHICSSGTVFDNNRCVPVTPCFQKPDGFLYNHSDYERYIECQGGKEVERSCPPGEFFLHNRCYKKDDILHYCRFNTKSFQINENTRVICVDNKPVINVCEGTERFFGTDECQPSGCVAKPDGYTFASKEITDDLFTYVPGYTTCEKEREVSVNCSPQWDKRLAVDFMHLPMVYHNNQCEIPVFCENVFSTDPDVIVPKADFRKTLHFWKKSTVFDSLRGYTCVNKRKMETDMPPGYIIKKFKKEPACEKNTDAFPILNDSTRYYDCDINGIRNCPQGSHYNGQKLCVSDDPNAFKFKGLDVFKFDNITSYDNWIAAWNYTPNAKILTSCPDTEPTYISTYNICSHPDCEKYPFLSQVENLYIFLQEKGYLCTFQDTSIKKEEAPCNYSFWDQRCDGPEKPCQVGQKIQSGNFMWDSSIYATCNEDQPFVFCPSSKTEGIELVGGKRYACKFPMKDFQIQYTVPKYPVGFKPNELLDMHGNATVTVNKVEVVLLHTQPLFVFKERERIDLTSDNKPTIQLRFRIKQTYPPDVYYDVREPEPKLNPKAVKFSAFITKQLDFTEKAVEIPKHKPQKLLFD